MKRFIFSVVVVSLILFYACGSSNSPKAVMTEYFDLMDAYCSDLGKAGNADDVVKAVEKALVAFKTLKPKMKELEKKYPELKNMKDASGLPADLKEFEKRFNELMPKLIGAMGTAFKYMQDPKVAAAMQKFQDIMKD